MKSLNNFLTYFSLPLLFALNSIDSKSQDFLPGIFKDYQKDKKGEIIKSEMNVYNQRYYIEKYIDLDKDSLPDLVEVYPYRLNRGKLEESSYPLIYFIRFDSACIKGIIDENIDGLNNNEKFYEDFKQEENIKENL